MVTRHIDLQTQPGGNRPHLRFRQGETGEKALVIRLMEDASPFSIPSDAVTELCFNRSDECGFAIPCAVEGAALIADVVPEMTECVGKVWCVVLLGIGGEYCCSDDFLVSILSDGEEDDNADETDTA